MERSKEPETAPEDPTVEADRADPTTPGPGDSDAARPEPPEEEPEGSGDRD
jgi:hypothetical protein